MRDEEIRRLVHRLAGMSPEPPQFPEESMMARHESPRPRPNPILMFAAGAALVAAVLVPVMLLSGGEAPVGVGSTTTTTPSAPVTTSPTPTSTIAPVGSTTTTDPTTESTQAGIPVFMQQMYLFVAPENSNLGNPALVPVWLELTDSDGELGADPDFLDLLAALSGVAGHPNEPFFNAIPSGVGIDGLDIASFEGQDVWLADMNEAFLAGGGGLLADTSMLNQLIYTITQDTAVDSVLFTVGGQPVEAFGSEGIDLTSPVDRETFIEDLNPIFLTAPIADGGDGYLVAGKANTFEASLTVRVLDPQGNTVHEEPAMATCGTGCWGDFTVSLASSLIGEDGASVQLFTYSAKDGSMTDVITIPVTPNGVWEFDLAG